MLPVSQPFAEAIYGKVREMACKIELDGRTLESEIQNVKVTETANSETGLTAGSCCSSMLKASLLNDSGALDGKTLVGKQLKLYVGIKVGETVEYQPQGVFTVTECVAENRFKLNLTAYDALNFWSGQYVPVLTPPYTLKQLAASLCSQHSLELAEGDFPNSAYEVGKVFEIKATSRKMLEYIAQAAGCFARVDEYGRMKIDWYRPSGVVVTPDSYFDAELAAFEVPAIGKVTVNTEENDLGVSYGDGKTAYTITNNPLLYGIFLEDDLNTPQETAEGEEPSLPPSVQTVKNIYDSIAGLAYSPIKVTAQGNPALRCGDLVTFRLLTDAADGSTADYVVPLMKAEHEFNGGYRSTLYATGVSPEQKPVYGTINTEIIALEKKANIFEREIDVTRSQIIDIHTQNDITTERVSQVEQRADAIAFEFSKTGGDNLIHNGGFLFGTTSWTFGEGCSVVDELQTTTKKAAKLSSGTIQTAADIAVTPGREHALYFRYKLSTTLGGSAKIEIGGLERTLESTGDAFKEYKIGGQELLSFSTGNIAVKVTAVNAVLFIGDLTLVEGSSVTMFRQSSGEGKTKTVTVSDAGIVIAREGGDFKAQYDETEALFQNSRNGKVIARFGAEGAQMGETEVQGSLSVRTERSESHALRIIPMNDCVMFVIND